MLSPEDVCANIERVKDSERLSHCLDRIDLNKITVNSHGLTIKKGIYEGATLLLCALTKNKWNIVKALIARADVGTIDVYVALKDSDITIISFIPDYLMCEVIQKAKEINVSSSWRSKNSLIYDVIMGGHQDILHALLRRGLVNLELFEQYKNNNQQLKEYIRDIINKYLTAMRHIGMLPHAVSFNNLLDSLSKNDWLFDARQPNSRDVTFKDQIIKRLELVSKTQLRQFYNRFTQFKPTDFQSEEIISVPFLLPPAAATTEALPQPHQNDVVEIKKELSLLELLYQGKHEILIERLQKGEIAFELFEPFTTDAAENSAINYHCKNVIEVCLQWRSSTFDLPKNNAFQTLLVLFENNEWLFTVLDASSKKSLLELTRTKLQFKNRKQLEQFNTKFPNCDSLLNQINTSELQISGEDNHSAAEHTSNGVSKKNDESERNNGNPLLVRESEHATSGDAVITALPAPSQESDVILPESLSVLPADEQHTVAQPTHVNGHHIILSAEQSSSAIENSGGELNNNDKKLGVSKGITPEIAESGNASIASAIVPNHDQVSNVSTALLGAAATYPAKDLSVGQQLRAAIANYSSTHSDGNAPASLAALSEKHKEIELKKVREEQARQRREEVERETSKDKGNTGQLVSDPSHPTPSSQNLVNGGDAAVVNNSEAIISDQPKKDLQTFFNEQKTALVAEIYNREKISHDDKQPIINRIKEIFSYLIEGYKDNKIINQNHHHDLLDKLCDLYKDITEEEHKKKINIHSSPTYDKFFRKPNTKSWQDMVKDIRDKAVQCLLDTAAEQSKTDQTKAIAFLNNYINEPLFCEHRSNVAICRIGDTSAVSKIKDKIKEYEYVLSEAKKQNRP